ncbi:MAG TPA: PfkB family carbohydrate kinase, partial [Myxococcota bacterium]|nr:PfkB family carbohydrate kinase [Myxococcota bacterium]
MAARLELRRLEKLLEGIRQVRLLVVGDVVLDEYLWGDVERVSPEAPVPVVHVRRESMVLGGAGNVVRNAVALGAACDFCAAVGDDRAGARVLELLGELGVDGSGIVRVPDRPTTRKTRVVARSQQIVRFDRETSEALPPRASRAVLAA